MTFIYSSLFYCLCRGDDSLKCFFIIKISQSTMPMNICEGDCAGESWSWITINDWIVLITIISYFIFLKKYFKKNIAGMNVNDNDHKS